MKPECTHNSQVQRIWKVLEFPFTSSSFISQFAASPSSPALITALFLGYILCLSLYLSFPSSSLISIRQSFSSLASFTGSHLRGFYSENLCCLCLRNAQYVSSSVWCFLIYTKKLNIFTGHFNNLIGWRLLLNLFWIFILISEKSYWMREKKMVQK